MDSNLSKVLLIAYTFPPAPGVGGRRWVKFAKYLHRKGVDIKVIAAKSQQQSVSPWNKDLKELSGKVLYLNSNYPKYLGVQPFSLFEKIAYRVSRWYCLLKLPGNYYDKSAHWSTQLALEVEKEIRNGVTNIIVTCAPFIQSYHLCELKSKYPKINFIVDFRDPWVNNKTAYGFASLSPKRLEFEVNAEATVIQTADHVLTVAENMSDYFRNLEPRLAKERNHIHTLPNGYDRDDFSTTENSKPPSDKLRFVFTGTLYEKATYLFEELSATLKDIKNSDPELYHIFQFDFFGQFPNHVLSLAEGQEAINFKGTIPLEQVYLEIAESHICMLFLTDDLNYSFSTKFYEYISNRKPLAVFSKRGDMGAFVEENQIGYTVERGRMKEMLLAIAEDYKNETLRTTSHFDISEFDISFLTEKVIQLLK